MNTAIRESRFMSKWGETQFEGLEVQDLSKSFRTRTGPPIVAANRLRFEVPFGRILALVGASGCGKTTTLRAIAGLEKPDHGIIRLGERDISTSPPHRRDVAMVFQKPTALPHLSGRENLELALKFRKVSSADRQKRVEELADRLSLSDVLDRKIGAISGGELQRVALGRALLTEPRAMLLDEPSHFLDPRNKHALWRWVREIVAWRNLAAVVVTHDPREALALGDQVAVMRDGAIVDMGNRTAIFSDPECLESATALTTTSLNTLPGVLKVEGRDARFTSRDGGISLVGEIGDPGFTESTPAIVAIRGDALRCASDGHMAPLNCELQESRDVGFSAWRIVRVATELWTVEASPTQDVPSDPAHLRRLYAPANDLMLFHAETGQRIRIKWRTGDV